MLSPSVGDGMYPMFMDQALPSQKGAKNLEGRPSRQGRPVIESHGSCFRHVLKCTEYV